MDFFTEICGRKAIICEDDQASILSLFLMFCFDEQEAKAVLEEVSRLRGVAFVAVILERWDSWMIPWESKAVKGPAEAKSLSEEIPALLDEAIHVCHGDVRKRYLIGYSLGGLFAVWEGEKGRFDGIASVSGSMWYPDLVPFVQDGEYPNVAKAYFSIGDKESGKPSSPFYQVREKTMEIERIMASKGIQTVFELNEGNHFHQPALRIRKAVEWLLYS